MRGNSIHTHNLCFLGFGNVNRTLVRLLEDRAPELRDRHGIAFRITGIASRRLGWIADPNGIRRQPLLWPELRPRRARLQPCRSAQATGFSP